MKALSFGEVLFDCYPNKDCISNDLHAGGDRKIQNGSIPLLEQRRTNLPTGCRLYSDA